MVVKLLELMLERMGYNDEARTWMVGRSKYLQEDVLHLCTFKEATTCFLLSLGAEVLVPACALSTNELAEHCITLHRRYYKDLLWRKALHQLRECLSPVLLTQCAFYQWCQHRNLPHMCAAFASYMLPEQLSQLQTTVSVRPFFYPLDNELAPDNGNCD